MGDFTINGTHNMEISLNPEIPAIKPVFRLPGCQVSLLNSDHCNCLFQNLKNDTYDIWLSQYQMKENANLYGEINEPMLELQFMLGEGIDYSLDGFGLLPVPRSSFNLFYEPYVSNKVYFPKGSRMITFDIHLQESYLQNLCKYFPLLNPFLENVANGRFTVLKSKAYPVSRDQIFLINSILNSPPRPGLQDMILNTQIEALVLQSLSYLTGTMVPPSKSSDHELKAIAEAEQYMSANLDSRLTIIELANKFAINDCQFKKLFKEKYHATIHEYITNERLFKACELLRNSHMPINEIAFTVGYKSPSAFADKFKETFLITPQQFRK